MSGYLILSEEKFRLSSSLLALCGFPSQKISEEKLPFAPDLNLSNSDPKSYFRPYISYLVGLNLPDYQDEIKFFSIYFPTFFPPERD
jgi:hypothetical protein